MLVIGVVEIEQNNRLESDFLMEYRSSCYPLASQWVSCSYMPWLRRPSSVSVATTTKNRQFSWVWWKVPYHPSTKSENTYGKVGIDVYVVKWIFWNERPSTIKGSVAHDIDRLKEGRGFPQISIAIVTWTCTSTEEIIIICFETMVGSKGLK